MRQQKKLLPCARCGWEPVILDGEEQVVLQCPTCGKSTRSGQTLEQARVEWNAEQNLIEQSGG